MIAANFPYSVHIIKILRQHHTNSSSFFAIHKNQLLILLPPNHDYANILQGSVVKCGGGPQNQTNKVAQNKYVEV